MFLVVVFGGLDLVFNGGFFGSFSVGSVSVFLSLSNFFNRFFCPPLAVLFFAPFSFFTLAGQAVFYRCGFATLIFFAPLFFLLLCSNFCF